MQDIKRSVPKVIDYISQLVRIGDKPAISHGCAASEKSDQLPAQSANEILKTQTQLHLTGTGSVPSYFAVSDFAQSAIAVAVREVQQLRHHYWNVNGAASVDRVLASQWCKHSVYPIDWERPAGWDEFAGDYQCVDGWIRLHTNAPHHRQAALGVLGNPASKSAAQDAVGLWQGAALETAVVAAGGAAAYMMSSSDWLRHPQGSAVNAEPLVAWQEKLASAHIAKTLQLSCTSRPLKGLCVLDLTRVLAGPVCTRFLASLGADVLRIDPPNWNEDGNALEMTVGKRCAGLDLNKIEDRKVFESLLKDCDVLVHGYRRDALAGLGYDESALAVLNPHCIDVALNAYGWSGPWSNRRGFDSLVQMSTGIAALGQIASNSARPVPLPFQALDHVTGYLMAAAVVHAVSQRATSGRVFSARLSLARQAALLWEVCGPADVAQSGMPLHADSASSPEDLIDETHMADGIEQTPWGPLRRLKLPFTIEGVDAQFDHPVSQLRSSMAQW